MKSEAQCNTNKLTAHPECQSRRMETLKAGRVYHISSADTSCIIRAAEEGGAGWGEGKGCGHSCSCQGTQGNGSGGGEGHSRSVSLLGCVMSELLLKIPRLRTKGGGSNGMKQGMLKKVGVHVATTVLPREKIVHECESMVKIIQVWRSETAGVGQ